MKFWAVQERRSPEGEGERSDLQRILENRFWTKPFWDETVRSTLASCEDGCVSSSQRRRMPARQGDVDHRNVVQHHGWVLISGFRLQSSGFSSGMVLGFGFWVSGSGL